MKPTESQRRVIAKAATDILEIAKDVRGVSAYLDGVPELVEALDYLRMAYARLLQVAMGK